MKEFRDGNGNDALDLIAWLNDFDERSEDAQYTDTEEACDLLGACRTYLRELVNSEA